MSRLQILSHVNCPQLRPLFRRRAVGHGAADERGLRQRRRHHPGQRRAHRRQVEEETMRGKGECPPPVQ